MFPASTHNFFKKWKISTFSELASWLLYIETIVRYAMLYEKEILSLSWFSFNFEVNFHHISAFPQSLNYFKNMVSFSSPQPLGTLGLKKCAACRIRILWHKLLANFIRDVFAVFLRRGSLRSFVLLLSKSVMHGM